MKRWKYGTFATVFVQSLVTSHFDLVRIYLLEVLLQAQWKVRQCRTRHRVYSASLFLSIEHRVWPKNILSDKQYFHIRHVYSGVAYWDKGIQNRGVGRSGLLFEHGF